MDLHACCIFSVVYYHESSQSKETFRYFLVFVYFSEYKNSREQAGHSVTIVYWELRSLGQEDTKFWSDVGYMFQNKLKNQQLKSVCGGGICS